MRPSSSKPLYHPINNPPYQINYRAKRSGKHITVTKRRITFQFGFSNADAIASGHTEGECRGEEHEVVLIWSHVSGKRQVFLDGREVHSSKAAMGNTKFSYSWGFGSHVLKIVANGSPTNDGTKQFDLFLDGMSYFDFCQIYQLGTGVKAEDKLARTPSIDTVPSSHASSNHSVDAPADDDQPPVAELQIDAFEAACESYDLLGAEVPSPAYSSLSYEEYPSSLTPALSSSSYDEFAPVEANQKSFAAISSEILTAYGNESYSSTPEMNTYSTAPALSSDSVALVVPQTNAAQDPANSYQMYSAPQDPVDNSHALVSTNAPNSTSYAVDSPPTRKPVISMYENVNQDDDVDDITACMRKLVNFDDVSRPVSSSTIAKQADKTQSLQSIKWAMSNVGRAPTLSEIHSMKSSTGPSVKVMNTPPQYQYQASAAMVVHQGMPQQYSYSRAY